MSRSVSKNFDGGCRGEVGAHLSMALSLEDWVGWEHWVVQFNQGRLAARHTLGPSRCERGARLTHVPGGLHEFARDLNARDFASTLAPEALGGRFVVIFVEGVPGGVDGCLDVSPTQVLGAILR